MSTETSERRTMLKTTCYECLGETWTLVRFPARLCCFCGHAFDVSDPEVEQTLRQWADADERRGDERRGDERRGDEQREAEDAKD